MPGLRVFIAESLRPLDFYKGRLDGKAARDVLKIEHGQVEYRITFDLKRLRLAVREAANLGCFNVFHLSCHGDEAGIELTDGSSIDWLTLAQILKDFAAPERILVMSSCCGGNIELTKALMKEGARFGWVFGAIDSVGFTDSCLAWSVLYRQLSESSNGCARSVAQEAVDLINTFVKGSFVYRRWDDTRSRYRVYPNFDA